MTTATDTPHRLIVGSGDPDEAYPLPPLKGEFTPAPDLAQIGNELMDKALHLPPELQVTFLWKARGGSSSGRDVLGKCQKPGGLLAYFSETHYVVWLAADHIDGLPMSRFQVEALLYHELLHIDVEQDEDGALKCSMRGHDLEEFRDVVSRYGFWKEDVAGFVRTVQRLLPGFEIENEVQNPVRPVRPGSELVTALMDDDDLPEGAPVLVGASV